MLPPRWAISPIIISGGAAVPVAVATVAVVATLYLVLLVSRFAIRPGRVRLLIISGAMISMVLVSIVGLLLSVGAAEATSA